MHENDQDKFKIVVSCTGAGKGGSRGEVVAPLLTLFYPEGQIQESLLYSLYFFFCMCEMLVILF